MNEDTKRKILTNWLSLNRYLSKCSNLAILQELLETEISGRSRQTFLTRIHQRITSVRSKEERKNLRRR